MNLLALVVALPLLGAFLMPALGRVAPQVARLLGPFTLLCCLLLLFQIWHSGDMPFSVAMGGFMAPLGINLYADGLALLFAALALLLILFHWPWRHHDSKVYALLLLLAGASSALALSGDLFNIFVFYELASVASFALVTFTASRAAYLATFRYLLLSGMATVLFLCGIAIVYAHTGTLNLAHLSLLAPQVLNNVMGLAAFVLILLGLGVKAELFFVNSWVPEVYSTAPSWVSGLLAGVLSKLAVLVLLRLLILVFDFSAAHDVLLVLGLAGFISGELAAWRAQDFRRMLAFSSIGHLGLIFIGFSISGEAGVLAGLALALNHLLLKPGLFALAASWSGSLGRLRGAAHVSPLAAITFIVFALSAIGVPPLPGFWAKMVLVMGLAGEAGRLQMLAITLVLLVTVVEAGYLLRLIGGLYVNAAPVTALEPRYLAQAGLLAGALVLAGLSILPLSDSLSAVAAQASDNIQYAATVLQGRGQ